MSPLGLPDLWPFLFLFTYVSPGITRPVAFLISIYIYLPWDYKTCGGFLFLFTYVSPRITRPVACGISYFYLHMSPLGLLDLWCFLFLFTYVSCGISYFYLHMSPLGLLDLWHFLFLFTYVSPGITRPVAFLISIYICLPWGY